MLKGKSHIESDSSKTGVAPSIIYADTIKVYLPDRNGFTGSKGQADIENSVDPLGLAIIFKKFHPVQELARQVRVPAVQLVQFLLQLVR